MDVRKISNRIKKIPIISNIYYSARYILSFIIKVIYYSYIESKKDTIDFNRRAKVVDLPRLICDSLTTDKYKQNTHYGLSKIIKEYAGIEYQKELLATIEHGIYLGGGVWDVDLPETAKGIITFSKYREKIISRYTNKKILTIGPYIHYANLIDNQKLQIIKQKLGKTLLFFPAHSSHRVKAKFDHSELIRLLVELSKNFDSTLVCFYWKDYDPRIVSLYLAHGFHCTTAGHMFDWNFLNRLKSIIYLSDITASNATGTHVGYCIYMRKPHWLFKQKIDYEFSKGGEIYADYLTEEHRELIRVLENHSSEITDEQYSICEYLWGFNEIKSKEELKESLYELIK